MAGGAALVILDADWKLQRLQTRTGANRTAHRGTCGLQLRKQRGEHSAAEPRQRVGDWMMMSLKELGAQNGKLRWVREWSEKSKCWHFAIAHVKECGRQLELVRGGPSSFTPVNAQDVKMIQK